MSAWSVCRSPARLIAVSSLLQTQQKACAAITIHKHVASPSATYACLAVLQVVMRIRPSLQHGVPSWSKENCIHAVSASTVAIAPPESSQGYRNGDRGQTYNFTRVFNEHTAQEEYFQATAAPLVIQPHVTGYLRHVLDKAYADLVELCSEVQN